MTSTRKAVPVTKNIGDAANKHVLKATAKLIKFNKSDESNQLDEDIGWKDLINDVITPPYPLLHLYLLRENNSELGQCIDAIATNVDGFGYRLIPHDILDKKYMEKNKSAISIEHSKIKNFLDTINFEDDITSLRINTTTDKHLTGNAYWEFILDGARRLNTIERMKPHNIRMTSVSDSVVVEMSYYNSKTKTLEKKKIRKRFRRFVQIVNNKKVWFKEWGDPRNYSSATGKLIPAGEIKKNKSENTLANAVFHFKIPTNRSPYGIPKYMGNLFSIYGSRASEEINFNTLKNNNVPSMIISVSNASLTDGSIKRMEEFVETRIKASNNYSSILVIEAEPMSEDTLNPGTMKMDIKDVKNAQTEDQLFQKYDANNIDKIRRVWRIPPIFVGKAEDYNRATADTSRKLADEQIFGPMRDDFDKDMNKILMKHFNMKYHTFKSNTANVTNDQDLVKILSTAEKTGGITPNLARRILSDVLNIQLPDYDESKIEFDPNIPLSLTLVNKTRTVGGNNESGVLAPNQNQTPKDTDVDDTKKSKLEILEKNLLEDIETELGKS